MPHLGVKEKFYKIGTNTDDKGIGHEKKWKKIVDIYNFNNHSFIPPRHKTVGPGFAFYRLMCNNQLLQKYQLTIKMPETFM